MSLSLSLVLVSVYVSFEIDFFVLERFEAAAILPRTGELENAVTIRDLFPAPSSVAVERK